MTCSIHVASQPWCRECARLTEAALLRETITGSGQPSPVASGPTLGGEDFIGKTSDERRAMILDLMMGAKPPAADGYCEPNAHRCAHCPPSPASDASAARIAGLERSVNEKRAEIARLLAEVRHLRVSLGERHIAACEAIATEQATIAALQSQLASESREVLMARVAALATALRLALADVDSKAMSTYEQQAQRRAARALLEEA